MDEQGRQWVTHWVQVKDGYALARMIFDRHYSRYHYADGRKSKLFVGPGEKMVRVGPSAQSPVTPDNLALFV